MNEQIIELSTFKGPLQNLSDLSPKEQLYNLPQYLFALSITNAFVLFKQCFQIVFLKENTKGKKRDRNAKTSQSAPYRTASDSIYLIGPQVVR